MLAEQSKGAEEESTSASERQKLKRNSEQRFAIGEKKSKASDPAKQKVQAKEKETEKQKQKTKANAKADNNGQRLQRD